MVNIVTPEVQLLAHTKIDEKAISEYMGIQDASTDAETLITFAGRACYQSFHRPNEAIYNDADYLRRTLGEQAHWSISEHATATLYFTGVSRAFTHELIRHRHLSYSQLSQRFVYEGDANIVMPPALADNETHQAVMREQAYRDAILYNDFVTILEADGLSTKQAREAARAVLPNMTETRIVVTGNLRAWHEVIQRRTQPDADAEMQEVMQLAKAKLHTVSPNIFPKENH